MVVLFLMLEPAGRFLITMGRYLLLENHYSCSTVAYVPAKPELGGKLLLRVSLSPIS